MKLYYSPGACSLADNIALHEAGIDFERIKVDLKSKRTEDGRDFAKINPKGYVPALELDNGEVLTENIAVLSYIAALTDGLIPTEGLAQWRVLETTAFISTEIHKNFKPFFNPKASDAERDEARGILVKRFAFLGDRLGERDFVVGDDMSIADCYLFVMLMWAMGRELELPASLAAYHQRLRQRPAVKLALEHEGLSA